MILKEKQVNQSIYFLMIAIIISEGKNLNLKTMLSAFIFKIIEIQRYAFAQPIILPQTRDSQSIRPTLTAPDIPFPCPK